MKSLLLIWRDDIGWAALSIHDSASKALAEAERLGLLYFRIEPA